MSDGKVIIDTSIDKKPVEKGLDDIQKDVAESVKKMQESFKKSFKANEDEMKQFTSTAIKLWKGGFSESADDAAMAIINVKKRMEDLTPKQLEDITKSVLTLSQKFDVDLDKSIERVSTVMNEFEVDSKTAIGIVEQEYKKLASVAKTSAKETESSNEKAADSTKRSWKESLNDVGKKMKEVGEKAKTVGENMSKYLTLPLTLLAGVAVDSSLEINKSQSNIQSSLGLTDKQAKSLTKTARNVWKQGFGENLESVTDAVIKIRQNMGELDDISLRNVAKGVITLEKKGLDVNETTRTASLLMKNFKIDAVKALDLITVGYQKGGDFAGDLLDTLSEYSPQFAAMGLSAEDMLNILISGAENGAFNLDKVGDSVKELGIRVVDGSKTTQQGFKMIGLNTKKMSEEFAKGGDSAKKAFQVTVAALASIKDPVKQQQAGVALFGTQWEDVKKNVILAMDTSKNKIGDVTGAMKKAADDGLTRGERFAAVWRKAQDAMAPLGDILLKMAEEWLPKISDKIKSLADWFNHLSPAAQKMVVIMGIAIAVLGPLVVIIGVMVGALGALATAEWAALAPVLLIIGAIIAVIAVVALVIIYWDKIKEYTIKVFSYTWNWLKDQWNQMVDMFKHAAMFVAQITIDAWNWIKDSAAAIWNGIKNFFVGIWNWFWDLHKKKTDQLKSILSSAWNWIKDVTSKVWNGIKGFFVGIWDGIKAGAEKFKNVFLSIWQSIKSGIKAVINPIIGFINRLLSGIENMINAIAKAINSIPSIKLPKFLGGGKLGLPHIGTVSLPRIPALEVGTNLVAKDGLAFLHEGEAVVPKKYNPAAGGQGGPIILQLPDGIRFNIAGYEADGFIDYLNDRQAKKQLILEMGQGL